MTADSACRDPQHRLANAIAADGPIVVRILCEACAGNRNIAIVRATPHGALYEARLRYRTKRPGAILGPAKERYQRDLEYHLADPWFIPRPKPLPADVIDYAAELEYRILGLNSESSSSLRAECAVHGRLDVDEVTLLDACRRGRPTRPAVVCS